MEVLRKRILFHFCWAPRFSHSSRKKNPIARSLSPVTLGEPRLLHQGLPTFRATLSRKLTAPFCRLPLPTLFYRLEAAHLGDLMRLWVRPDVVCHFPCGKRSESPRFSRNAHATWPSQKSRRLARGKSLSPVRLFPGTLLCQQRKDNSPQVSGHRAVATLALPLILLGLAPAETSAAPMQNILRLVQEF